MPRILHLVHVFPPECRGGTETYAEMLARSQQAAGGDVRVFCGSETLVGTEPITTDQDGIRVTRFPNGFGHRELAGRCADITRSILDEATAAAPDLVHLHHWHHLSNDLVRNLRRAGLPVLASLSDLYVSCPLFFRLPDLRNLCAPETDRATCIGCLSRATDSDPTFLDPIFTEWRASLRAELDSASAITVLSHSQRRFLEAVPGLEGLTLEVLPYPSPVVAAATTSPALPDRPLRLVSWGGLAPGKGLHTVVEAAALLADPRSVEIHHYGTILDEAYRDTLLASSRETPLTFHGRFGRDDLAGRFSAHHVAVFPSLYLETHGLVVDEAVHLGLPVIVSDRGAPQERIGERGFVVPAGDARALAELLERMVRDPGILARARAAPIPPLYDLASHLRDVARVYRAIQPMFGP